MKNLIHLTEYRQSFEARNSNDFIKCLISNPNSSGPDEHDETVPTHYTLSPSGNLSAVSFLRKTIWSINLNTDQDNDEEDLSWFHLFYDENSDRLIALSHSGAIVSIDPFNRNEGNYELIGKFDNGIACADWSADGEVLALVTYSMAENMGVGDHEERNEDQKSEQYVKVPTLMTMNCQFEILAEENLPPVSIKADESMIHICWNRKYDNALIAVSCHDYDDDLRKIRIFKSDTLELLSMSRTEDGSGKLIPNLIGTREGSVMKWAGSNTSNLLACVQRKGKRGRNIIFLEPNGLQHGGFKLDQKRDCEEVVGLNWNSESDILAVTLIGTSQNENNKEITNLTSCYGKIQFYHRSNYHWYLKYEIQYDDGISVSTLDFDKVRAYDISIGLHDRNDSTRNEWRNYTFVWDTSTLAPGSGVASVVDGHHLNLSMFKKAIIPPPMYSVRLSFSSSVVAVSHNPTNNGVIDFAVCLSNGMIVFCGTNNSMLSTDNRGTQSPEILSQFELASALASTSWDASCLRQLLIIDAIYQDSSDNITVKLAAVLCSKASDSFYDGTDTFVTFSIEMRPNQKVDAQLIALDTMKLGGKILRMVNWSNISNEKNLGKPGALLEMTDGSLLQISCGDNTEILPMESEGMFLEPCPWIAGLMDASYGRHIVIGLSSRYRLYCGERLLCDASSSFCLSPATGFLSYATLGSRSQLRFLPLEALASFDPLMGSDANLELLGEGYEPRNVERGSRLVSILPDKVTAILQLPRGNLEAVNPRALLLPRIMSLIDQGEYHLSLDMMRRQKVDMNLIVDMNPIRFLESEEGVEKLVKQVKKIDHLNLFIASLQNFDITMSKYPVPKWFCHENVVSDKGEIGDLSMRFDFSTKVNKVCEKMRVAMMDLENMDASHEDQFLLPILSTFAKQVPPKLEDALSLIKKNAMKGTTSNGVKNVLLSDKAQSSFQYLAFLADYELLFDTALGMYDFNMAKAVARNSQMDPKVYLPLVKRLSSLAEFEAKYEVDIRLKRYDSALSNLYKSKFPTYTSVDENVDEENFIQCMSFIEKHSLHKLGLELFVNHSIWHGKILISMGENLLIEQKPDLALAVFLCTKPKFYDGAKRAARTCGDWKTFFACLTEENESSPEVIRDIAVSVAEEVSSGRGGLYSRRGRKDAAARILLDYCHDVHGAIDMLMSAELWFEARRIAILHEESEMVEAITEAAVIYSQSCVSDFEERVEKFAEANLRYSEVVFIRRQAKRDGEEGLVDDDNIETGSLFSMASQASNTSVRSSMSTSSVGSVSSLSSVISAGASTTFTVVNHHDTTRHKSKFNNIGKTKKKKKTRRERMSLKPGSEEELQSLIGKLEENIIDDEYLQTLSETIKFLAQVDMIAYAKVLHEAYESFRSQISQNQQIRINEMRKKEEEMGNDARREGRFYEKTTLDCEDRVDKLCCNAMPPTLETLFMYKLE